MKINNYIKKVHGIIADYRNGDNIYLDEDHINKWLNQFNSDVQLPIIRELSHILENVYFSKSRIINILNNIVFSNNICGDNIKSFWENVTILNIQKGGTSQKDILYEIFNILHSKLNINKINNNLSRCLVYIDDFLYHGNRIYRDIEELIPYLEDNTFIHIIVIGQYKYGAYNTNKRLIKLINQYNKKIEFKIWRCIEFENTQFNLDQIDTYYPTKIPDDYIINNILRNDKYPFKPRRDNVYKGKIFNNEDDRKIIEEQFLLAGSHIISLCNNPHQSLRPMGISGYGLGFGSPIVTYRNCPNNSPLALWWGSEDYDYNHPLNKWYPLFPRKTYR